jgi:hypothetical protein
LYGHPLVLALPHRLLDHGGTDADGNDADHAYEAQAVSRLKPIAFALFVLLGLVGCGVVLWAILHMPA